MFPNVSSSPQLQYILFLQGQEVGKLLKQFQVHQAQTIVISKLNSKKYTSEHIRLEFGVFDGL